MQRSSKRHKTPAVVLGFNGTALGIIRELGRRGVPVIAVDSSKNLAWHSKYCSTCLSPDMEIAPDAFLRFLINLSKTCPNAILFPSNDTGVLFITKYYEEIEPHFRVTFQNPDLIKRIVNKGPFFKLARDHGAPVPNTLILESISDLSGVSNYLSFPLILKPFVSNAFERVTGRKWIKIISPEELEKEYKALCNKCSLIVQEIVSGPDEEQFSCAVYIDRHHRPLAVFNAQKIRSHPIESGAGTLVKSISGDSFTSIAVDFLCSTGYTGIAEVEFKRDHMSGQYKMIEVNARSWAQNILAEKCGVPLSYIAYRDLIGDPTSQVQHQQKGLKWISFERDIFAYLQYKEQGCLNVYQYLKSLAKVRVFSTFAWDDLMPFFYYLVFLRHIRLHTILKKFCSRFWNRILPRNNGAK